MKDEDKNTFITRIKNIVSSALEAFSKAFEFIYALNPVTGKRQFWFIPSFVERTIGSSMYHSLLTDQGGETFHLEWERQVEKVGKNLSKQAKRELDYEFAVIRSRQVNAWALPWGKIAIYEGLLRAIESDKMKGFETLSKEDKIAAVLSHEIIHADARHTAQRLERAFLLNIVLLGLQVYLSAKKDNTRCSTF